MFTFTTGLIIGGVGGWFFLKRPEFVTKILGSIKSKLFGN
jgi:hypothetical protein